MDQFQNESGEMPEHFIDELYKWALECKLTTSIQYIALDFILLLSLYEVYIAFRIQCLCLESNLWTIY